MPRICKRVRVDVQLGLHVRGERVMTGKLLSNSPRGLFREAFCLIERCELIKLRIGLIAQFDALYLKQGLFGVALCAYGYILPDRHRQGSRHEPRHAGGKNECGGIGCARHTDDDGGDGDDAVIGPQDGLTEPIQFRRRLLRVHFVMDHHFFMILRKQAGGLGIEPRLRASKAPVLPLYDPPNKLKIAGGRIQYNASDARMSEKSARMASAGERDVTLIMMIFSLCAKTVLSPR